MSAQFGGKQDLLGSCAPVAWLRDPAAGPFGVVLVELAGINRRLGTRGLRIEESGERDRAAASLKFYRDTLGMHIAGESENYGTEQEHLNNVFGARLRITSLRAAAGPGIELLEYLAPRDGRPTPRDSRTDDLWSWKTTILSADAAALAKATSDANYQLVSSGLVTLPSPVLDFRRGELVRDPDGHVIRIVER